MISKNQKHTLLRSLLSNSLPVLCKNGLGIPDVKFSVEAFVGITVGEGDEVILVSIKETVTSEGVNVSHVWSDPHEDIPNTCDPSSGIKQEVNVSEAAHESEVCDLTEEPEETNEVSERFNCQRSTEADTIANYVSSNWMVKEERICSDMESLIKKEHHHYESTCSDIYAGEETSKEDEEDYLFPANRLTSQPGPHSRRRDNNCPRMMRGGRSRFMQRGRFRRFVSSSNHGGCSSITSQNPSSLRQDQRSCDDLALTSGGGAYQDLMKEMCEQVVNQSMSVETQYVCHICQARRCSKSSLMDHIRGTHLAMDKYTCRECGERFRWFMQLHRHRKKFHPEPGDDQAMGDGDYATDEYGGGF